MTDFLSNYFAINFLGSFLVMYCTAERTISNWKIFLVTIFFTPIGGFLAALCYPTFEDVDLKKLIIKKLEEMNKQKEDRNLNT